MSSVWSEEVTGCLPRSLHMYLRYAVQHLQEPKHKEWDPFGGDHGIGLARIQPKSYPNVLVQKRAQKKASGVKVVPQSQWTCVKRQAQKKESVFVARLVFHRTFH